jgi:hypothetical protein
MTRFLVYALIFLSYIVLASCAVDQGSSALLDNFDPDRFPSFSNMVEDHRKPFMTPGSPPPFDVAGMQGASGIRSHPVEQTTSVRSGALATTETYEAASLSGYLFQIDIDGFDCSDNFKSATSTKLNACITTDFGSLMITATVDIKTTTYYSDSSCTKSTYTYAAPYTSGCVPGSRDIMTFRYAGVIVITPTPAYPFPLSHFQAR